jgi:hypothetical protein
MTRQRAALPICLVFDGLADLSCAGFDLIRASRNMTPWTANATAAKSGRSYGSALLAG